MCAIAALLVGCSTGGIVGVGFGTGGSECELASPATTFPVGVAIRDVLWISPDLPAGGTVTITVEKDGTELADQSGTFVADEPTACIHATRTGLEPGHYRVEYAISPSSVPPIVGEFEVTP